jgi:hypothetical protein
MAMQNILLFLIEYVISSGEKWYLNSKIISIYQKWDS